MNIVLSPHRASCVLTSPCISNEDAPTYATITTPPPTSNRDPSISVTLWSPSPDPTSKPVPATPSSSRNLHLTAKSTTHVDALSSHTLRLLNIAAVLDTTHHAVYTYITAHVVPGPVAAHPTSHDQDHSMIIDHGHAVILLRLNPDATLDTIATIPAGPEPPLTAAILRGPSVLISTPNAFALHILSPSPSTSKWSNKRTATPVGKGADVGADVVVRTKAAPVVVVPQNQDVMAVVITVFNDSTWHFCTLRADGLITKALHTLPNPFPNLNIACTIATSARCCVDDVDVDVDDGDGDEDEDEDDNVIVIAVTTDVRVAAVDIVSGKTKWTASMPVNPSSSSSNRAAIPVDVAVYNSFVFVVMDNGSVYTVRFWPLSEFTTMAMMATNTAAAPNLQLELAFPSSCDCTTVKHDQHATAVSRDHFYPLWRDRVLRVDATTGIACHDFPTTTPYGPSKNLEGIPQHRSQHQRQGQRQQPSLQIVVHNLRARVDAGVDNLVAMEQRSEEKRRMLLFATRLLADVARAPAVAPRAGVLNLNLRPIITRTDRRRSPPTGVEAYQHAMEGVGGEDELIDIGVAGGGVVIDGLRDLRLWVPGQAHTDIDPPFVRMTKADCRLDLSEQFVVVNVVVDLLNDEGAEIMTDDDQNKNDTPTSLAPFSLQLGIRIDRCVSSTCNTLLQSVVHPGACNVQLGAAAPLADLVTAAAEHEDVDVHVRVDTSDDRSQHLGEFNIRHLLSSTSTDDSDKPLDHAFNSDVFVIAEGPSAHRLDISSGHLSKCATEVFRREGLTCVGLKVASGVELATAAAHLKMVVDDDVTLRRTLRLDRSSLTPIHEALTSLEEAMQCLRQVATPADAIGFAKEQVGQVLHHQQKVNDAFGRLEEMLVGL